MTRAAFLLAALLGFSLLATANSGGYRYGVSDQAFYVPAIALRASPDLFPRDRAVFEPQMRLWLGDEILGALVRRSGVSLPVLFAGLYVLTMAALVGGASSLARALGCRWDAVALALLVMTLRHRIARTGANSLEGYMHPRMLAFAVGLAALGALVRLRWGRAVAWTVLAAIVHTSTAIWFAAVIAVAALWRLPARRRLLTGAAVAVVIASVTATGTLPRMDAAWLGVLADRDYLFSSTGRPTPGCSISAPLSSSPCWCDIGTAPAPPCPARAAWRPVCWHSSSSFWARSRQQPCMRPRP